MFDPVSIVGFVGTTAGLVSFAASAIERLHDKKVEFQDCRRLLAWYKAQYDTTHLQLECWSNIWCFADSSPSENRYIWFWGPDGLRGVDQRMKGIREEAETIKKLMFFEGNEEESTQQGEGLDDWRKCLEKMVNGQAQQPLPESWMRRFCFALYKHADIKTRINCIREKVADLDIFSKLTFWKLQEWSGTAADITSEELKKFCRVKTAVGQLETFLRKLAPNRSSNDSWALILGRPVLSDSLLSLEEDKFLTLEFLIEDRTSSPARVDVVFIDCPLVQTELGDLNDIQRKKQHPERTRSDVINVMKTFLRQAMEESELRKASELLRAKAACDLVDSLIICYGTPCTQDLCTCGMRATHPLGEDKFWSFRAIQATSPHPCHDPDLGDRGFVLLAVVLAELALSAPISVLRSPSGDLEFRVDNRSGDETLNLDGLFRRVSQRSSRPYRKAVEYCFEMDQKLTRREIRPDDFGRCVKKISKPVHAFMESIQKEYGELRQQPWFQTLEQRYRL